MTALTPQQQKRLLRLAKVADSGEIALIEEINSLEERIDDATGHLIGPKGDRGETGPQGESITGPKGDTVVGPQGKPGQDGRDGVDGISPDPHEIALDAAKRVEARLTPLIPTIDVIEDELVHMGDSVRKALEILRGDHKLSVEALKEWPEIRKLLDDLSRARKNVGTGGGRGVSGSGGRTVMLYDLSSQLNGVLKTFALPAFWRVVGVYSSSFPNAFRPTVDYTVDFSTMSITFTSEIQASSTLATGQTILVQYAEQ